MNKNTERRNRNESLLSYGMIKNLFLYDPEKGELKWTNYKNGRKKSMDAGSITHYGYRVVKINGILYAASRLIYCYMKGYFPEHHVDHKDRNKSNDKWINLGHKTHSCNMINKDIRADNKTGVTGVTYYKRGQKFEVNICKDNINKYCGRFKTLDDAVKVRWKLEVENEFENCNTTSSAYLYLKKRILI